MKHVFINHSNITRIIILNLINDYKLDKKNCIVINVRDQKRIKENYLRQPLLFFPYIENYNYHRVVILGLAFILKCQMLLLTRGKFSLYAPNYSLEFVRVISILTACIHKNQIEDGFVNYRWSVAQCKQLYYRESKGRFKYLFDSSGLVNRTCINYYCIDAKAFIGEPLVFQVNKNILDESLTLVKCDRELNILVLEQITMGIKIDQYLKIIVKFLTFTNERCDVCYIKFHPDQPKKEIIMLKKFIESEKLNEVFYLNESIEALLLKHNNVVIHSYMSTLLIYQHVFTNTKGWCYILYNNNFDYDDLKVISNYANLMSI